jgi:tripartite-type tricarboxylate transporter receptor subunit TctC
MNIDSLGRRWFTAFTIGLLCATPQLAAHAQAGYPEKPIRLVIPFAAAGPTDRFARRLADVWAKHLGTQIIVENRTGSGTIIGTEFVANARPDGYTILMTTLTHALNPFLYSKLPYDTVSSFVPVGLAATSPLVLIVRKDMPVKTVPEFLSYLKANPGKINYGSAGKGTSTHIAAELMNVMAKVDTTHIPYRGSSPAAADLLGGNLDFMIDSAPTAMALAKAGSVRMLATTLAKRLPQTPETPALAETVPGYEAYTWNAVFAPAGTPPAVIKKLASTMKAAMQDNKFIEDAYEMGVLLEPNPDSTALQLFLNSEMSKWSKVLKAAKIQPE